MAIQNVNSQATPAKNKATAAATGAENTNKTTGAAAATAATTTANNAAEAARANASGVNISSRAKEMALAKKVVENTPDVREDKVAKYKEMIAKGQYKPDAAKITEGIIREAARDELAKNPDALLNS